MSLADVAMLQLPVPSGLLSSGGGDTTGDAAARHSRTQVVYRKMIDLAVGLVRTRLYVAFSTPPGERKSNSSGGNCSSSSRSSSSTENGSGSGRSSQCKESRNGSSNALAADRTLLADLYNDLWDACLEANNLGLDCVVLTSDGLDDAAQRILSTDRELTVVLNGGPEVDRFALGTRGARDMTAVVDAARKAAHAPALKVVSLANKLTEETSGCEFVLYDNADQALRKYKHIVLGGTFDHFHNGHKKLLTIAAQSASESITIGITSPVMLAAKSNKDMIEGYEARERSVVDFLACIKPSVAVITEQLQDPFGPSIRVPKLEAIVVSSETVKGARLVNEKRKEAGLSVLDVVVVKRANVHILSSSFVRTRKQTLALSTGMPSPNLDIKETAGVRSRKVSNSNAGSTGSRKTTQDVTETANL